MPKPAAPAPVTEWRDLPMPAIDSSTPAKWSKTWIDQLQWMVDYVKSGATPLAYDGDYSAYAADLTIGDVPWDPAGYRRFAALRARDPRWRKLEPVLNVWYTGIYTTNRLNNKVPVKLRTRQLNKLTVPDLLALVRPADGATYTKLQLVADILRREYPLNIGRAQGKV